MRPFFHGVRMASDLYYSPFIPAFSSSGAPSAGAKLRFRYAGTTTPAPVYSDAALTVPLTNPVVANAAGRFPPIYMNDAITYRIDYLSPTNAQLDSVDPYVPGVTSAVLTVASGSYVSTRTALAAISAPVDGQIATLTEAGREGMFRFSTANLSAQVTLDTRQGLYVAPAAATSGASGAWVRVVPDNIYQASWFGTSSVTTDNQVAYNAAGEVLPDGAILVIPPYTQTASAPIVFKPGKAIHLRGADPDLSHIAANAATLTNFTVIGQNSNTLVHLCGSGSSAKDFTLSGPINNVGSGEPAALTLGKYLYLGAGSTPVYGTCEDMEADNIRVLAGSAGIRVVAYFRAKPGAVGTYPADVGSHTWDDYDAIVRPVVRNCKITADRVGLEYYCVQDARCENNFVTITNNAGASVFTAPIRVLGCQGFISTGGDFGYMVETDISGGIRWGLFIAEAGINDDLWTPANEKVRFFNVTVRNANRSVHLGSSGWNDGGTYDTGTHSWTGGTWIYGDILIDGLKIYNPLTGTNKVYHIEWEDGPDAIRLDKAIVRNATIYGGSTLCRIDMPIKHLVLEDIHWIANEYVGDSSVNMFRIYSFRRHPSTVGGHGLHEIRNVRMISKQNATGEFNFGGYEANSKIIMHNCWSPSDGTGGAQIRKVGTTVAGGKIITDCVTEQDLDTASPITSGLNYRYPAGAWARATA